MDRSIYPFSIFDPWHGRLCTCPKKYSLNPYTGCSFACLYCYSKSYIGKRKSHPKKDFLRLLYRAIPKLDNRLPVNIGTSSDPYPPEEEDYELTREAIKALIKSDFRVLITTKGGKLLERDIEIMLKGRVAVTPTVTTMNASIAKRIEPGAPEPSERITTMKKLSIAGLPVGARVDPIIPGINDDEQELRELVRALAEAGAKMIVTSTYKAKPLDFRDLVNAFPELENRLRRMYFEEGEIVGGYRYLKKEVREALLRPVVSEASKLNLEYATCREGLLSREFFKSRSCDGTHLTFLIDRKQF
ncbi:MAG: radical SAM protein [Thermoprotei archaeon]|nr:radical SAM protein [Thermoprotei archaeon]